VSRQEVQGQRHGNGKGRCTLSAAKTPYHVRRPPCRCSPVIQLHPAFPADSPPTMRTAASASMAKLGSRECLAGCRRVPQHPAV
jgi:hypothetical protein